MGQAKKRPMFASPTDYEDDFHQWAYEQAELLQQKRFSELDIPNLIEEIEDMAKTARRGLESSYRLVISHLLKWTHQRDHRSRSWRTTIVRERGNIERDEEESPSLAYDVQRNLDKIYRRARREAASETDLPLETFPAECPFTPAQLRDDEFLPD